MIVIKISTNPKHNMAQHRDIGEDVDVYRALQLTQTIIRSIGKETNKPL